ncbi:MAG: ABC transporter substrate-binding protein [Peptococcaceae bacterium]|jgi:ABC-type nitrate/sulfonate/bicarbonate transport system substrate-binding protein|nr:ABC transporter substrate-binding protein [Peptococcaceae bacterium]
MKIRPDRKILILLVLVLAMFQLTACGSTAPATSVPGGNVNGSGEKEYFTLRVNTPTNLTEYNIADQMGFFEEEGIKLKYVGALGKGVTAFQLLEQGEIDAVMGSHPPQVAQARLAGIKARIVAPAMIDDSKDFHVSYLVRADSPIQSLSEAVGKKVQISSYLACTNGYVEYYLIQQGLDPKSVEFVVMSDSDGLQALDQGLVDIVTAHPPFSGIAKGNGQVREIYNTWEMFHNPGAGLASRCFLDSFIDEHPDVVQGAVNALYRARVWINAHPEEALQVAADFLNLPPDNFSAWVFDHRKNIDQADIELWFSISEIIGFWQPGEIQPEEIYTNQFVPRDIPSGDATRAWADYKDAWLASQGR